MAIYGPDKEEIKITGYCGKAIPDGFSYPAVLVLVKTRAIRDGKVNFWFARDLTATGGFVEIDAAVDAADGLLLSEEEMAKAAKEAS